MKLYGLALILVSTASMAVDGVGGGYFYSHDTDDNVTHKVAAVGWITPTVGVSYARGYHRTTESTHHSDAVEAVVAYRSELVAVEGSAGVGQVESHQYFSGDIGVAVKVAPSVVLNSGVYGDIVDSHNGLANGIALKGGSVGGEYYGDQWGVSIGVKRTWYTNNNIQTGNYAKVYKDIVDGVAVFASWKQFENSKPNNDDFWSPEDYKRVGVGATYRTRLFGWKATAMADFGQATIGGDKQPALSLKGTIGHAWGRWGANFVIGAENTDGTKYRYQYVSAKAYYSF